MTSNYNDIAGLITIASASLMKILNALELTDINSWSIALTGIGGLIYLYYKVKATRTESKTKDIEYKLAKRKLDEKI